MASPVEGQTVPHLPPELIGIICSHFVDPVEIRGKPVKGKKEHRICQKTLLSMALTCRDFRDPALKALYHTIKLDMLTVCRWDSLLTTLLTQPKLARYVREFYGQTKGVESRLYNKNKALYSSQPLRTAAMLWAQDIGLTADSLVWHFVEECLRLRTRHVDVVIALFQCPKVRKVELWAIHYIHLLVWSYYVISKCERSFRPISFPLQHVRDIRVLELGGERRMGFLPILPPQSANDPVFRNFDFNLPKSPNLNSTIPAVHTVQLHYTFRDYEHFTWHLTEANLKGYLAAFSNITELCLINGHASRVNDGTKLGDILKHHVPQVKKLVLAIRYDFDGVGGNYRSLLGSLAALHCLEDLTISLDIISAYKGMGEDRLRPEDLLPGGNPLRRFQMRPVSTDDVQVTPWDTQSLCTTLPQTLRVLAIIEMKVDHALLHVQEDPHYELVSNKGLIEDITHFMSEETEHPALSDITLGISMLKRDLFPHVTPGWSTMYTHGDSELSRLRSLRGVGPLQYRFKKSPQLRITDA